MARAYSIEAESGEADADETKICLRCGYGLTGLGKEGICPECGFSFHDEWVLTGYKNKGGPGSNIGWGLLFILFGSLDLLMVAFTTPTLLRSNPSMLWANLVDPCNIIGAVFLLIGLRGILASRRVGGNLRWVINEDGVYSIRGEDSLSKRVPWSDVRKVSALLTLGIRPRRWRCLKIRRRWSASWEFFRRKTPVLWLKGRTRGEMIEIARTMNQLLKDQQELVQKQTEAVGINETGADRE